MAGEIIKSDEERREIVDHLTSEYNLALSEREGMEKKWAKWRRQREGRPEQESKSYPWSGSANVCPPMTLTNVNTIYADLKATFSGKKPFAQVEADPDYKELQEPARVLGKYLNILIESKRHINLREVNNTILYDLPSMGTQFAEVPWLSENWMFKRRQPDGSVIQVNKKIRNSPGVIPIRMEDFVARPYFFNIQTAPWVAVRNRYAKHQLRQLESQGFFENIDQVEEMKILNDDNLVDDLERKGVTLKQSSLYEIVKFHHYYDVDDDGFYEDIILYVDVNSGTVVREDFNDLGIRNIVRIPYIHLPYQLYAQGVCSILEYLQDEVEALHNMRIDGIHISLLQMYIYRRGCGIGPNEEFYPFKGIPIDGEPGKDFLPVKFPDIGPSSMQAEAIAKEMASLAVGATNARMGQPDTYAKTRATASGTMFLAQQGGRLFNAVAENPEEGYADMLQMFVFQLVKNRDQVDYSLLPPEEAVVLKQVLDMEIEDIPLRLRFRIQTTEIDKTEEAKRQNVQMLSQIYNLYGQQVMQLVMLVTNPQVDPATGQPRPLPIPVRDFALKFITGSTTFMEKIFKSLGETQVDKYLPYIKDLQLMLEQVEMQKEQAMGGMNVQSQAGGAGAGPAGGGAQGSAGPGPGPGNMAGPNEGGPDIA